MLFIPDKIKVGYQEREDTYTWKLGYVIYYDAKWKLRKEPSFRWWISKELWDFDNIPTEWFVINIWVWWTNSWWNHRKSYIRIYDPRWFEFEISVENLLFLLESNNSIKWKWLEWEFVYSWDGKDLVLLPVNSKEFTDATTTSTIVKKVDYIKPKELIIGNKYLHKNWTELVYLWKHKIFDTSKRNTILLYWDIRKEEFLEYEDKEKFVFMDEQDEYFSPRDARKIANLFLLKDLWPIKEKNLLKLNKVLASSNYLYNPKYNLLPFDNKKLLIPFLKDYTYLYQHEISSFINDEDFWEREAYHIERIISRLEWKNTWWYGYRYNNNVKELYLSSTKDIKWVEWLYKFIKEVEKIKWTEFKVIEVEYPSWHKELYI